VALRDVEYARAGEKPLLLDLYLPDRPGGRWPVIVSVHGGGWAAGSKEESSGFRYAAQGYAVASIGYRLSGEAIFPAQIEDCKAAVRWLRANADKYNLDPSRFAAWGGSAGGHLAALLGTSGGVSELEGSLGNSGHSSRVQAVIDFFGPTDLLQMDAQAAQQAAVRAPMKHDAPNSPESRLIGGPIQDNKEKANRANPIRYVSRDDPPFLIMHGDQDPLVPIGQSRLLHEALRGAGVEVSFIPVIGGGHGFSGPDIDRHVDAFLEKHLKWQAPRAPRPSRPSESMEGRWRIIPRGDVEILTYESEENLLKLERLYEEGRKSQPLPGAVTPQYIRSHLDGSIQPYGLWLPQGYAPSKKYPLLVQLHGIGPKSLAGRRVNFRGMGAKEYIDPDARVIYAQCYGRGNTFYQGMGEVDILEVIGDVQRRFSVDDDRVFIMGHSMGGAGSFTIGLHYPDRFGSITPVDPALGGRITLQVDATMPEWMQPQVAIQTAANLYANARNVPVYFKNAGAGIGGFSTHFTDGIIGQGGFSTTEAFPGMPHHFAPSLTYGIFTSEAVARPIPRIPAQVKFYTNNLRYNRAYWLTIDRLARHNADAFVSAVFDDGSTPAAPSGRGQPPAASQAKKPPSLNVLTRNVDALTLRAGALAPRGTVVPVLIDRREISKGALPEILHVVREGGAWRIADAPAIAGKRHGMQGPIGDAFRSKFLAVYGKGDKELAIAELNAIRNPPGQLVNHGDVPMKAAEKVVKEDVESSNLILFGDARSNPIIGRLAASLPPALLSAAAERADIFVYPNPENPQRYVVIWSARLLSVADNGLRTGFLFPADVLPDYVRIQGGKVESGGFFDNNWKLPE
jgi:acetyl esterase/lipase